VSGNTVWVSSFQNIASFPSTAFDGSYVRAAPLTVLGAWKLDAPRSCRWTRRRTRARPRSAAQPRSREAAFQQNLTDPAEIARHVAPLPRRVADDMVAEGRPVRTEFESKD
jgi:hypothetical protein